MQGQPLQAELVGTAPELGYAAVAITVSLSLALFRLFWGSRSISLRTQTLGDKYEDGTNKNDEGKDVETCVPTPRFCDFIYSRARRRGLARCSPSCPPKCERRRGETEEEETGFASRS